MPLSAGVYQDETEELIATLPQQVEEGVAVVELRLRWLGDGGLAQNRKEIFPVSCAPVSELQRSIEGIPLIVIRLAVPVREVVDQTLAVVAIRMRQHVLHES